jgi:hypothetical protein
MTVSGRCHCGAIRYTAEGEPLHHAVCHCGDCRRHAGAPMVGWIAFQAGQVTIEGTPVTYESSEHGRRQFCGRCGTGLFYTNDAMLPGLVDIQSCTLDDPGASPPGAQIQLAERLAWTTTLDTLPGFERYPPMG